MSDSLSNVELHHEGGNSRVRGKAVVDVFLPTEWCELTQQPPACELLFRSAFESSPECFGILQSDRLQFANPAWLKLLAADRPDQILRKSIFEFVCPEHHDALRSVIDPLSTEPRDSSRAAASVKLLRCDQTVFEAELIASAIPDQGHQRTLLVNLRDNAERVQLEESLREREARLRAVIDSEPECVKRLGRDGTVHAMNPAGLRMIQAQSLEEVTNKNVSSLVAEPYRMEFQALLERVFNGETGTMEFECHGLQGDRLWLETHMTPLRNDRGEITDALAITRSVTERKRSEALLNGQKVVLEMIARDVPLQQSLSALVNVLEEHSSDMIGSILLLDQDRIHLLHGASPSLPLEYSRAIDGVAIGPDVGSCGRAAYCGCPVIVTDIETDPLWENYKQFALPHGLRACWSIPIFDSNRNVLGTFAIYFREPKAPTNDHWRLIDLATQTAAIAISKHFRDGALHESQLRWQMLVEQLPAIAWATDCEMRFTLSTGKGLEGLGLNSGEVVGVTLWDFFQTSDPTFLPIVSHQQAFEGRSSNYFVNWLDRWFEAHVRPLQDSHDKIIGAIGIALDVTEKKRTEEELLKSEERYRTLFEHAGDAIFIADQDQRLQAVNQRACELFGFQPHEFQRMPLTMLVAPSELDSHNQEIDLALVNEPKLSDRLFRRGDGSLFPGELNACRLADGRILGIVRDISERKRAETELRKASHRLQNLSRELLSAQEAERRHVARELHDELGQILTAINLSLQSVREMVDGHARERIDESLEIVEQATRQVRNLSLNLRPSMLDDFGLVAALEWYFDRQRLNTGLQIQFHKQIPVERLHSEIETTCFRVAQEAITNVARHAHATQVEVDLTTDGTTVELVIRDNGIGFDVTAARDRASQGGSIGLLSISERVQLTEGRLEIISKLGEGTTITATLPKFRQ